MRKVSSPIVPRELVLLACGWIIAAWLLTLGVRGPLIPTPNAYHSQVRLLLLVIGVGFFIGWPLLRLSQRPPRLYVREILLDVFILTALWQVMFWPLGTVTDWPYGSLLILNALVCLWTLVIGAIVALAVCYRSGVIRSAAMAFVLAITLLPMAIALGMVVRGHRPATWTSTSPLELIRQIASPVSLDLEEPSAVVTHPWIWLASLSIVAVLAWISIILRGPVDSSGPRRKVEPGAYQGPSGTE